MTRALANSALDPIARELLRSEARTDLEYWERTLQPLTAGTVAHGDTYRTLHAIARSTGRPFKTVRKKFYAWRRHGALGLLDRRLCGPEFWRGYDARLQAVSLNRSLQEHWRSLVALNQRAGSNGKNAWLQLCQQWKERAPEIAAIPEYRDFPGWPALPPGWSYDNLMQYAPTDFEQAAASVGRLAAKQHRSTVYTTRVGLWSGSHYLFDDKWHDLFVNSFAELQAGRPLELYSLDLFSACKRRWGVRVRTKNDEGKYHGIEERMTRLVLAATLFLDGYSPRGTVLVTEGGTARIDEQLGAILHDLSGGLIVVDEGKAAGAVSHFGQYPALRRGNPQHKAALESNNNLEHNRLQHLPGQTGRDLAHRPDELDGRLKYNDVLLAAYAALPPEVAKLLEFPLLELNQFMRVASEVYAAIADTRDHALEGWIEAGNVLQQFSWGGTPLLETALTPEQREAIPALLASGVLSARPVRMSRREAWQAGAGELIRLPGAGVCAILGDDLAREVTVTRGEIAIEDKELGPGVYRFDVQATDHEGRLLRLRDSERFQGFVNPFAPDTLFLRDAHGRYVGESRRIVAASRADAEQVQRAIADAARRESEALAALRARTAPVAGERAERHAHNARVLRGAVRTTAATEAEKHATAKNLLLTRSRAAGEIENGD